MNIESTRDRAMIRGLYCRISLAARPARIAVLACALFGLLAASVSWPARGDVPPAQRAEVEHLLAFIRTSSCSFVRNGREYGDPERAYRHVMRKYEHFRDEIGSTEEFIELAATRSLLSGREYAFRCAGGRDIPSGRLLRDELSRFRRERAARPEASAAGTVE